MSPAISSQKQYISTYMSLIKKAKSEDIGTIFDFIKKSKVTDTTKLSYLNSIISLKKLDSSLVKGDLSQLKEYRDSLGLDVEKKREMNNTNERQSKALQKVSLEDLQNFVKELNDKKNESIKDLDRYILVKLMVTYPVRNDLQDISLTRSKKDLELPLNSLFVPNEKGKNAILSIKEYKTAHSRSKQDDSEPEQNKDINITLDADISNDIRTLIEDKRTHLFVNQKGEPLSSSSFTHRLNKIFLDKFGVPISSTIIRKIYVTGKYAPILKEMEHDAAVMGHNIQTQQKIYVQKKDGKYTASKSKSKP